MRIFPVPDNNFGIIARKQKVEAERLERIFDPKMRIKGVNSFHSSFLYKLFRLILMQLLKKFMKKNKKLSKRNVKNFYMVSTFSVIKF
jgi:hypothetical protein